MHLICLRHGYALVTALSRSDHPATSFPTPSPIKEQELIIELEDVYKSYGDLELFKGLSLQVRKGEAVIIMGESGSGKSQLIRLMNGLVLPDRGSVRLFGKNTREMSRRELMEAREKVGTLFQNYALFDSMTVEENVAFPLIELKGMPMKEALESVTAMLEQLGLGDAGKLYPSSLSGGMKKRVSLARALIVRPEVVLFDEPTTGLDPVMIEFVDEMLLDARREFEITSVIISHDMASAFKLADRMAMLHDGKITFVGSTEQAKSTEQEEVRRFVHAATSRLRDDMDEPAKAMLLDAKESDHIAYRSATGVAVRGETDGLAWEDLPTPEATPIVTIENVEKSFGDRRVLHGTSFYILPKLITTIIGGSGSGKTVLMKHVLGLFQPTAGRVTVFGDDMSAAHGKRLIELRSKFGMLFQSAALFDSMTILENTMFPLLERPGSNVSQSEAKAQAMDVLKRLKIDDLAQQFPGDISNGQRKRAGLARAMVTQPDILIYDEPTTGLDPVMTSYVNDMIVEAQEAFNITALIVSHDMASTFRISHRVAMLYKGRIIAFGTADDIRRVEHPRVREFIFAGDDNADA